MIVVMPNGRASNEPVADPRVPRVEMQAHAAVRKGTGRRSDSVHRVALFGGPLARAAGACGSVPGRMAVAELWTRQSQHVCVGRRVFGRAVGLAAGAIRSGSDRGEWPTEAAVGLMRGYC